MHKKDPTRLSYLMLNQQPVQFVTAQVPPQSETLTLTAGQVETNNPANPESAATAPVVQQQEPAAEAPAVAQQQETAMEAAPVDDLSVEEKNLISCHGHGPDPVQPLQPQVAAPAVPRSSLVANAYDEAVHAGMFNSNRIFGCVAVPGEVVLRILFLLLDAADNSFMSPGNYSTFHGLVNLNRLSRGGHHIVQSLTRTVPLSLPMIMSATSDYIRTQFEDSVLWPVSHVVRIILQNAGWNLPEEYICPLANCHSADYNRFKCRARALPRIVQYYDDFVDDHPRSFTVDLEQLYDKNGRLLAPQADRIAASDRWAALWCALSPPDRVKIWHAFVRLIGKHASTEAYAIMDEEEAAQKLIQEAE